MRHGKVVGGYGVNGTVSLGYKGDLVLQTGFRRRKLTSADITEWEEVSGQEVRDVSASGAVAKAVAGSVLPGLVGKAAVAAINTSLGSGAPTPRTVRIDWSDGKQSLVRLPDKLFTHLALVLRDRQTATLALPGSESNGAPSGSQIDIAEQIGKLALLRNQKALTEEEFSSKKAELLARL